MRRLALRRERAEQHIAAGISCIEPAVRFWEPEIFSNSSAPSRSPTRAFEPGVDNFRSHAAELDGAAAPISGQCAFG